MILNSILFLLICSPKTFYTIAKEAFETEKHEGQELLLCRKCGTDVADAYYLFNKQSPGAHKVEKQHLFGRQNVTVQTLINPFGIQFEVITAQKARCENVGQPRGADSWFPGYGWRICACPHCGHHLGWTFHSVMKEDIPGEKPIDQIEKFHGLILTSILGENYNEAILAAQKQAALEGIRYGLSNNDAESLQDVNVNQI